MSETGSFVRFTRFDGDKLFESHAKYNYKHECMYSFPPFTTMTVSETQKSEEFHYRLEQLDLGECTA